MTYRNFINFPETSLDKPIYRIFPVSRFIQALIDKTLTLVKPKKWDDPFENLLLSSKIDIGGEDVEFAARDTVYGQCWTWHRETDAMWRIYSPNKDGVRISSTPRILLSALKASCDDYPELRCFIGSVKYLSKPKLLRQLDGISLLDSNGSGIAESLLYKRLEFSHEKEVRVIYCGETGECDSDIYHFPINTKKTLSRVLFDPRMDEDLRQSYIQAIELLGYEGEIKRSTLYDPPEKFLAKYKL